MNLIEIRGARQHNLKNIDLSIPRNSFVVITGVSGSGKSSLAFDTLFAEGQRRYIEALSAHARLFMQRLDAPLVDEIKGLSPSVAIEQKRLPRNPRSTVGTLTEINDFLRLLFARIGQAHCPKCSIPIRSHTISETVNELFNDWAEGTRLLVLAPLDPVREKELPGVIGKLKRDGFARIRLDGRIYELEPLPLVPRRPVYRIEVVVDRLVLDKNKSQRLSDSLELAAALGKGTTAVAPIGDDTRFFSDSLRCVSCGFVMPEPNPGRFSFHHPEGVCSHCKGLGFVGKDTVEKKSRPGRHGRADPERDRLAVGEVEYELDADYSDEDIEACPRCLGTRLNELARAYRLGGLGIHEAARLCIPDVHNWLTRLDLTPTQQQIAERPMREILSRLQNMQELGLSYLTLDRPTGTLSGGEVQRIRLSHQIGSALSGVLYVLDEPSIGLHPRDHRNLLHILLRLRDAGNSIIVVEHDRETIRQADFVVDMGPGAGVQGGEVVFAGTPDEMMKHPASLTGRYLSGMKSIRIPPRREPFSRGMLTVVNARGHNLKGITARIPLACLTCVTGVSGSGKSTLVLQTLYRALARKLTGSRLVPAPFDRIDNADAIQRIVLIDQAPLGRTPRSTPATHSGLFTLIRQLYSHLPESRARGYGPPRFSYNARGGRCEACAGEGLRRIEMLFLPDVAITCPSCGGRRYNMETLQVLFKGHSIASVLDMTVYEAAAFFDSFPSIRRKLNTLIEVGLGYIRLGQAATTLSGGEAQRVKLAGELSRKGQGKTLYILDEPTTGLHFDDIEKLLHVLQRLVDEDNTIVLIEHHPDVIKTADYLIDLGPEGGDGGGQLVAEGTPEEVARAESSCTGRYLRDVLPGC
jgi:excinuclease ABC subunit A